MADANGFDFSQYLSWRKIVAPTGAVYYVVPDTGYVYDPFLSQQKGRPVLWENPEPAQQEKEAAKKKAEKAASPEGQLLPIAGVVGGTVGAKYLVDALGPATALEKAQTQLALSQVNKINAANAAASGTTAQQAFTSAAGGSAPALSTAGSIPVDLSGAYGVQTLADGSTLMSDGSITTSSAMTPGAETLGTAGAEAGIGVAPYIGAAGAALGAYGVYNAIQNDDSISGAMSGAGLGAGLAAAAPLAGFGPLGWGALGLAALGGAAGGFGLTELLGHKSTKQYQAERWGDVKESGVQNADAAFAANHPEGDDGTWDTGDFAGKKWNWEDAKTLAKQDPIHFNLVLGNFETFGNDWNAYDQQTRNQIISRLVDEDLYESTKGDIRIKDSERARQIKDEVLGGVAPVTTPTQPQKNTETPPGFAKTAEGKTDMNRLPASPLMGRVPTPAALVPASPVMGAQSVGTPLGVNGWTHPAFAVHQSFAAQPQNGLYAQAPAMGNMGAVPIQRPAVLPSVAPAPVVPVEVGRTLTRSPGIGLDGKPLTAQQLGQLLAKKQNSRR